MVDRPDDGRMVRISQHWMNIPESAWELRLNDASPRRMLSISHRPPAPETVPAAALTQKVVHLLGQVSRFPERASLLHG